jgi:cardiolipin synthase
MARSYLNDLTNATEVVLRAGWRARRNHVSRSASREGAPPKRRLRERRRGTGSAGRGVAGAIRLGNTVSAAVTDRRVLAAADARIVAMAGVILVAVAVVAVLWPRIFAIPLALLSVWFGGALLLQSYRLRRTKTKVSIGQKALKDTGRDSA